MKDIEQAKLENIEVYLLSLQEQHGLDDTAETVRDLALTKLSIYEALVLLNTDILEETIVQFIDKETNEVLYIGDLMEEVQNKIGA